jgi:hypothetical protein
VQDEASLGSAFSVLRQYDKIVQDPDVNFDLYGADIWATAHEPGWGRRDPRTWSAAWRRGFRARSRAHLSCGRRAAHTYGRS